MIFYFKEYVPPHKGIVPIKHSQNNSIIIFVFLNSPLQVVYLPPIALV